MQQSVLPSVPNGMAPVSRRFYVAMTPFEGQSQLPFLADGSIPIPSPLGGEVIVNTSILVKGRKVSIAYNRLEDTEGVDWRRGLY